MRRNRSDKHGILYDGADPSQLLSRGLDVPAKYLQFLCAPVGGQTMQTDETVPPILTERFPSERLANLKDNWDGYGAKSPDPRAIIEAHKLFTKLSGDGWQVVPTTDGGVQIERHTDGVDVEIVVTISR